MKNCLSHVKIHDAAKGKNGYTDEDVGKYNFPSNGLGIVEYTLNAKVICAFHK
jgi:hypothetical protein